MRAGGELIMSDVDETPENTLGKPPETLNEAESANKKKKNIDEMIEEFNRKNPVKNPKKIYGGVF